MPKTVPKPQKLAEDLLRKEGIDKPPVPIEALARGLRVSIKYEPFYDDGDLSGVLRRTAKGAIVGINSLDSPNRQRFTIAHELGHFLLHTEDFHVDEGFRLHFRDARSSKATDASEIEANLFAASLMMPASFLKRDIQSLGGIDVDDAEAIARLAKRYEVSPQAMTFRLANVFRELGL